MASVFALTRLALAGQLPARLRSIPGKYFSYCGAMFVVYTAAIYLAVGLAQNREQLLEVALINYLWPSLTVLLSLLLLKGRASIFLLPGTGLALAGVFLVMTQGTNVTGKSFAAHLAANPAAYGLALLAAVSWAFYSNFARLLSKPGSSGAVEFFLPVTGLVLTLLSMVTSEHPRFDARAGVEACVLAAITGVGYILWDVAMRKGNLLLVVICSYFTPLLSTVVSCVYLRVSTSPRLWTGCLLLVAGSILTWKSVKVEAAE